MAIRNIVEYGDEILRKVCRTQLKFDEHLHLILDDMAQTMYAAEGVGLAAPQVGILRRFCVVDVGDGLIELVNPVLVSSDGEQTDSEGCLSIPGKCAEVTRPMNIKVRAQDRFGENFEITASELKARAILHEMDHLDGILYIDRV